MLWPAEHHIRDRARTAPAGVPSGAAPADSGVKLAEPTLLKAVLDSPGRHLGPAAESEPVQHAVHVALGGAGRDHQRLRDLAVAETLRDQDRDVALATGQHFDARSAWRV